MEQTFRPSRKLYVYWKITELIGYGGFGQCWKVEYRKDSGETSVGVIKLMRVDRMTEKDLVAFIKEEENMRLYQYAHLIRYIDACVDEQDITRRGILMEYCTKGSLKKIIHDPEIFYPDYRLICWGVDLFDALDYLKRKGVIHMDVKPDNIFATEEFLLKIADLGAMQVVSGSRQEVPLSRYSPPRTMTSHYQAPEHHQEVEQLTPKYDVFTMGLVLWELIERKRIFADGTPDWASVPPFKIDLPDCPDEIQEIFTNCTNLKERDRWGALRAKLELEKVREKFEQGLVRPIYEVEEVRGRTKLEKPFSPRKETTISNG